MNSVILIGRLTKDPESRVTNGTLDSATTITNFTIGVNRPYSKDNKADFIRIVTFGKTAENCAKYLHQGDQVCVKGRIQTGSYKNNEGRTIYTTDVSAEEVEFLQKKRGSGGDEQASGYTRGESSTGGQNIPGQGIPEGFYEMSDDDEEDIPF